MNDQQDFAQEEAHKSDLLLQAALLREQGELEQAAERFAAAAAIEESLAARAEAAQQQEKAFRLRFSAASGWAYAGDFHHALALLRSLEERPDTPIVLQERVRAFATTIRRQREHWHNALRETNLA
jgi:hypothetical protein